MIVTNTEVVVPYYLSQGYNLSIRIVPLIRVVVPYYLSQGYNIADNVNIA